MKAVGYLRVSTTDQVDNGVSMDVQEDRILIYCRLHDLALVEMVSDAGLSGKTVDGRPALKKLLTKLSSPKNDVQALVVFKLDRLVRNTQDALSLAQSLREKGITLHSVSENLDTSNACGELFFSLIAAMAQWERQTIVERTTAALARKKERGERVSRHPAYGYRFDGNHVVEDTVEQSIVQRIQYLSGLGFTLKAISLTLEQEGLLNRKGKRFGLTEIYKIAKGNRRQTNRY